MAKTDVVFVSYENLKAPDGVGAFVKGRRKDPGVVKREVEGYMSGSRRGWCLSCVAYSCSELYPGTLIIIDSLYSLSTYSNPSFSLPIFLSSLTSPTTSILAIYHTDIPLPSPSSSSSSSKTTTTPYTPTSLTLLRYLATTILTTHSFPQTLARKRAAEKSMPEPLFGIDEGTDGVLVGLGANDKRGCVVEMEYRRKSGRGVEEWFFLPEVGCAGGDGVVLLEDQELFRREVASEGREMQAEEKGTFELGLTEKQRREREGVVLPYFDAQKGEGGQGGRILYDMGVEDDFDEEEEEI